MKNAAGSAYVAVAGAFLLANAADAQSIEVARSAFNEGRFVEAVELAAALETSEGYALAAESLAIHGYHFAADDDRTALYGRAFEFAQEAIRLDAANPEAHFQSAHVMGRQAQIVGVLAALNRGYARKVRAAFEEALRHDPQLAKAHVSLGAWHAEIVSKMGRFVAGITYGASRREALAYFEQAAELAPDDIVVLLEYANGLLLLGRNRNREQTRELLTSAVNLPPKNAYDRIVHEQAVERLTALESE